MRITLDASRLRFEGLDKQQVIDFYNDGFVKEQYRNDLEEYTYNDAQGCSYVGAFVDGDLGAMFYCIDISPCETEVHLAFYKEYTPYSRIISKEFINWMFYENNVNRITTYVMDYRRVAVNLALKIGFKYEGFMRKCAMKDGVWYGKHVLGIVRG